MILGIVLAIIGLVISTSTSIILAVGIKRLKEINKCLDMKIEELESKEVK